MSDPASERRHAEEELRLFKAIVESSHEAVAISDPEGRLVYINPAHERLFGRPLKEARQTNYRDYYPPESVEILDRIVAPALARGESWEGELDAFDADGRRFPLWERADSLRDADENLLYAFGFMHDITQRRQLEDAIRRHRDHLEGMVAARTAELTQANEDLQQEIAERRRAENALRESEASLARAQQVAHLGNWNWDVKAKTLTWSDELYRIFGVEEGFELTYEAVEAMVHPDDREANRSYVNRLLTHADSADCSNLYEAEFRIIRPDGTVRHIFQNAEILRDEAGNATKIFGIMQDVTERKWVEQALAEQTHALRRRNEELVALNAIAATVNESLDLEKVLDRALDKVLETTGMEAGSMYLMDPLAGKLVLVTYRGVTREFAEAVHTFKLGQSLVGRVGQSGEPIVMDDVSGDPRVSTPLASGERIRAFASTAMKSGEKVQGVMAIGSHQMHAFSPEEVRLYTAIANQIGMAIENARLFEQVQAGREQLTRLTRRLVSAQEEERARLARELHDELGQALTAIGFDLEVLARELPPALDPTIVDRLTEARSLTARADEQVSELALDLRPDMLDDLGLVPTLRWYANKWAKRLNIEVKLEVIEWEQRLPPEIETALYRVVQEALTNVAKYAQATRIRIRLEHRKSTVLACVEDDGQGFDVERVTHPQASKRGAGLLGIRERVAFLGGSLHIQSRPGQGTRLSVEIPT